VPKKLVSQSKLAQAKGIIRLINNSEHARRYLSPGGDYCVIGKCIGLGNRINMYRYHPKKSGIDHRFTIQPIIDTALYHRGKQDF
jgi:hypothetical protein